jgi:diguanylate cyclase (GGDEF)-like protein
MPAADGAHDPRSPTDNQVGDPSLGESDQTLADIDQLATDRDQVASDCDLGSGVDPRAHEFSREIRQRTSRERAQTSKARMKAANLRDLTADTRDLVALARDQAADARDLAIARDEAAAGQASGASRITGAEFVIRATGLPKRAAQRRAQAAEQRDLAAQDRHAGAVDREQGAHERRQARADRQALADQLAVAETDALTGVRTRAAGLTDLDHELDRCRRLKGLLVVAYIDVVGLKALNDTDGHGAGDQLLQRVVALLREHLRSYDLIIRLGGDEFLCAMSNMTLVDARRRLSQVAAALAASPGAGAIRTGFAELKPDESAPDLVARADSELVGSRHIDARR